MIASKVNRLGVNSGGSEDSLGLLNRVASYFGAKVPTKHYEKNSYVGIEKESVS